MAKNEFPWDAVVAGVVGLGVGALLGRASVAGAVKPAGATTGDLSLYKALSVGRTAVPAPQINPATVLSLLGNVTCQQWTALPAAEKSSVLTWWLNTYATPQYGHYYDPISVAQRVTQISNSCVAVVPNIQSVKHS